MNIRNALKKAKKHKTTIKSDKMEMYRQTRKSLAYWLLLDKKSTNAHKIHKLINILGTCDWELEYDK